MRALSAALVPRTIKFDRPSGHATDQMVEDVLASAAKMLWPENTAPNLAALIPCDVRSVERYLEGTRKWSGDALAAIVAEILKRHHMRNFCVKKRE